MVSYSTGQIFGDGLDTYWYIVMIGPNILLFVRFLVVLVFFNFETPIHYQAKADQAQDPTKIEYNLKMRDRLLDMFYENENEIVREKERLDNIGREIESKKIEMSLKELIMVNCIDKKTRWSCLCVLGFNFFPPFAGQAYADNYTTSVFDK
jgi:hypothetical protein